MANSKRRKKLGKGLDALLPSDPFPISHTSLPKASTSCQKNHLENQIIYLDPETIHPNPQQPRTKFSDENLEELAQSIQRDGIQEPILVRETPKGYELISGERRVRASILAKQKQIPAIVRQVSDEDMLRLGLIENIQREDLNPIELARAYKKLQDQFQWTQEQLATEVGKKRVTIANTLRLLNLPPDIQELLADGRISMGHARALLAIDNPEKQRSICLEIIENGLSVRDVEQLATGKTKKTTGIENKKKKPHHQDPDVANLENRLRQHFKTKVTLRVGPKNSGKIEITYYNLDDLDRILEQFGISQ